MMAFVSMAMLATVSCSKDNDDKQEENTSSLKGTQWVCNTNVTISSITANIYAKITFVDDSQCEVEGRISSLVLNREIEPTTTNYTYDGRNVTFSVPLLNEVTLAYDAEENTLTLQIPAALSAYLSEPLVFYRIR